MMVDGGMPSTNKYGEAFTNEQNDEVVWHRKA